MGRIANLNAERAIKEGDARLMSVRDCLEAAIADIDSGERNWDKCLLIFHTEDPENRTFTVDMRCSGVTTLEARGLMFSWMREDVLDG